MLYERGVVQSIASWNRERDVLEVLESCGISQYFLYPQVALGKPKPEMLRVIKQELDLTKWSDVVFVDDEESNLAEVNFAYPDVITLKPEDLEDAILVYFTKRQYTQEDRLRVRRYEQERLRKEASKSYGEDRQAFLASCGIQVNIAPATHEDIPRVYDLVKRANRMSALAHEFTEEDLNVRAKNILVVRVKDKFGDYGLSGMALTTKSYPEGIVYIEALVISCRLQGKGIGSALISHISNQNREKVLAATWVETEYNQGFRELYKFHGFRIIERTGIIEGHLEITALKEIREFTEFPSWLNVVHP